MGCDAILNLNTVFSKHASRQIQVESFPHIESFAWLFVNISPSLLLLYYMIFFIPLVLLCKKRKGLLLKYENKFCLKLLYGFLILLFSSLSFLITWHSLDQVEYTICELGNSSCGLNCTLENKYVSILWIY